MTVNELMIGDWVQIKYGRKLQLELGQFYAQGSHEFMNNPIDYFDGFDPIPLTEEILKANGFRFDDEEREYCLEGFPSVIFDYYCACIYWQGHLLRFYHVHDFQHALRLCGLNELADTFKV